MTTPAGPDPELVERLAGETAALYADVERRLLRAAAEQLEQGMDAPTWAQDKLAEVTTVRRRAEGILARARTAAIDVAVDAILAAFGLGAIRALRELRDLGRDTNATAAAPAVNALVREFVTGIQGAQVRVLRDVLDQYRDITTRAAAGDIAGAQTRRQATQTALNRLAGAGLTAFVDSSGRRWQLPSYAEMTTRTITAHARTQGHLDTLRESGYDLVYVSDSPRECTLCAPWEHKVLSLSSAEGEVQARNPLTGQLVTVDVAGSVATAVAAGLQHPNCTHSLSAYLPGVTRLEPADHNPDGYAAKQQQRYLERQVRHWKRREAVALDEQERKQARRKVRAYQGRIREHLDEWPELKRLRYREQLSTSRPEPPAGPDEPRFDTPPEVSPLDGLDLTQLDDEQLAELYQRLSDRPDDAAAILEETSRRDEQQQAGPLDGVDVTTLSDEQIAELFGQVGDDPEAMDTLVAEMDRRDNLSETPAEVTPQQPDNAQEWLEQGADLDDATWGDLGEESEESRRVDELVEQGVELEDAIEQVYGVDEQQQQAQRQRELVGLAGRGGNKAEQVRQAYYEWVHSQFLRAEQDTRGVLLTREGQAAGIDPQELFSGPAARARKYASEELKRWWVDNTRMTLAEFREQYLGWETDRRAARRAREQGAGREFGL